MQYFGKAGFGIQDYFGCTGKFHRKNFIHLPWLLQLSGLCFQALGFVIYLLMDTKVGFKQLQGNLASNEVDIICQSFDFRSVLFMDL